MTRTKKSPAKPRSGAAKKDRQVRSAVLTEPKAVGSKAAQDAESGCPFNSPILGAFLSLVKEETGVSTTPADAVFHRKYAKFRHLPYPDSTEESRRTDYMQRTWINVLLHEGMTDELRKELYPNQFDLGNTHSDSGSHADFSELLLEINGARKEGRGENVGRKQLKDFETVLKGIVAITGINLGGSTRKKTIDDLKVVKLLYRVSKERASHLFGLIACPGYMGDNATLEFRDSYLDRQIERPTANEERIEANELLVADLTSYLSVEIPSSTIERVNALLLTHSKLLECIAIENDEILEPIRAACALGHTDPSGAYLFLAQLIQIYPDVTQSTQQNPLSEALYTYLRSLHFQHFVGGYSSIVGKAIISEDIKPILSEVEQFCEELSEANTVRIGLNTPVTSIEAFPNLVKRQSSRFRALIKSATGLATRHDGLDDICSHASKILSAYMLVQFAEKDPSKKCISIADCIASLIAVRHQQSVKTDYKPRWFGLKDVGDSPLRYFDRERGVRELQATDYIPEGVNQLLYQRFCQIHVSLVGDQDRHESWMTFQIARLHQYVRCIQSNNISEILRSISCFNDFCSDASSLLAHRIIQSEV
ncbi:hypothetical protein [Thermomonas sp.]|uniref:hypothetical protein n=1 Tax=Thermomonas sp. TaxID=1971895 RepID=UPI00257B37B0|nr:hypothetical protein [Thermomonas sp.]